MTREERLDALRAAADRTPGLLELLERDVARVRARHREYRGLHWGERGAKGPVRTTIPDVSEGVTVMGALCQVTYLTAKRGDGESYYEHDFKRPYPLLCVAPDGSRRGLVIARGDSRYAVQDRGIVG